MKINPRLFIALLAASSLSAAPLTKSTAVYARPDANSPAVAVLDAGTEPAYAAAVTPPAGWTAVELPGPHEVYVQNKDIMKSLDVRPGASFHTAPKADAPVLTTMDKGDPAEISGLHGRWTQIRLQKKVIGYIGGDQPSTSPVMPAASAGQPGEFGQRTSGNATGSAAPMVAPAPGNTGGAGQVSSASAPAPGTPAALPRLFEGTFLPATRFLAYKPYEYQLNDRGGKRYAFLDLSRLAKTEQVERFLDRTVVVYGTAKPVPNTKDIVIEVESLQLR